MTARKIKVNGGFLILFVILFVIPVLSVVLSSCNPGQEEVEVLPGESFDRIYDKPDTTNYLAMDIKRTGDNHYIMLGINEGVPYLLKVNRNGDYVWDMRVEEQLIGMTWFVAPATEILKVGNTYYVFCLEASETIVKPALLKVEDMGEVYGPVETVSLEDTVLDRNFIYPMDAVATDDCCLLVLTVNAFTAQGILLKINPAEADRKILWEKKLDSYHPFCGNAYPFMDRRYHFIRPRESTGNNPDYYFQSYSTEDQFSNPGAPCFSIRMIDSLDNGNVSGIYKMINPLIAMIWKDDTAFGAFIENEAVSLFTNKEILDMGHISGGEFQAELKIDEKICINIMDVDGQSIVFFAGSTKNNRIVLYLYDRSTGGYINKAYFGHTHIYEAADLISTGDNGMAILGTTFVAGRQGRFCLIKLSQQELRELANFSSPSAR